MRRFIDLGFPLGRRAAAELGLRLLDAPARPGGTDVVVRGDSGWLVCTPADAEAREDEWRMPGALHLHRFGRSVPVELVLARWSAERSELRLELRCRRSPQAPPRYFDVAHAVMDELRDAIEATIADVAPGMSPPVHA